MMTAPPITIEGLTAEEWLALPEAELATLILTDRPITFNAGSAQVLGSFSIDVDRLVVELAHIDGGGEGVLPALGSIIARFARRSRLARVVWRVHATRCANPNPKLLRVLQRRGFTLSGPAGSEVYELVEHVDANAM